MKKKEGTQKKRYLRIVLSILLIVTIVLSCLLLVLFLLSVYLNHTNVDDEINQKEANTYPFFQFDSSTDRTTAGFMTIFNTLEEGQFLSYIENEGQHTLVTNDRMGDAYKCTGECYCDMNNDDDDQGRRRSSMSVSKGLIYLVSATTSLIALNYAKDHFREDVCVKEFENECPDHAIITSYVKKCNLLITDSERVHEAEVLKDDTPTMKFVCNGLCLPWDIQSKDILTQHFFMMDDNDFEASLTDGDLEDYKKVVEKFNCRKHHLIEEVFFEIGYPFEITEDIEGYLEKADMRGDIRITENQAVEFKFMHYDLSFFCLETRNEFEARSGMKRIVNFCTSYNKQVILDMETTQKFPSTLEMNPSVKCVRFE